MPGSLTTDPIKSLEFPGAMEGGGGTGRPSSGFQHMITVPLGIPTFADSATYKVVAFVAPSDGWFIKEIWVSALTKIGSGTNTLAVDNYDASANAARNVQSETNIDPDTVPTTANEGTKLTLSATAANMLMDEGDVLSFTTVLGTQTTAGLGYAVTCVVVGPVII